MPAGCAMVKSIGFQIHHVSNQTTHYRTSLSLELYVGTEL